MDEQQLRLYAITDRRWLGEQSLTEVVKESLEGGVSMVQLREKELDPEEIAKEAPALKDLCRTYAVPLIINDHVDLAKELDADGVHIGQSDLGATDARALLGPDRILGVSARTVAEAKRAEAAGADYLGVGAVFPTGSKDDASVISPETLKQICRAVSIPVVAIGGITKENLPSLLTTGISGVALISALYAQKSPKQAAMDLRAILRRLDEEK